MFRSPVFKSNLPAWGSMGKSFACDPLTVLLLLTVVLACESDVQLTVLLLLTVVLIHITNTYTYIYIYVTFILLIFHASVIFA